MNIGSLLLALALPTSVYSIATSILGGTRTIEQLKKTTHAVAIILTLACAMLAYAFISDSFNVIYVASYSSRSLPFLYKLSGLWAGLDGSLLFWAFILSICASIAIAREECVTGHSPARTRVINAALQCVVLFFLVMLVFQANPFATLSSSPTDGRGLNPLLQNVFMLVHPPLLYVGYVGFTIPVAYAMASLILNEKTDGWLREIRVWTIISWLFLTAGNLLGAMWAYVELGWGGFWAWDPVENAGIMPWFAACALLHSFILQERRGMLRMWNVALMIFTFILTIFGTFITRSGVIRSVHSFSDITIGIYFIVFIAITTIVAALLILTRRKSLSGAIKLEHLVSREGSFYLNNVLLLFALGILIWGTVLPLLVELFTGQKGEVGPKFFNSMMAPIGILLLFLTGIGPEMSWRHIRRGIIKRDFLLPAIMAGTTLIMTFIFGVRKWFPACAMVGAIFMISAIADEFVRSSGTLANRFSGGKFSSFLSLFRRAPRRYGGYIVHFGIAILFVGLAGSAYQHEHHLSLKIGEISQSAGYEFLLKEIEWVQQSDNEGAIAHVFVSAKGQTIAHLTPALYLHRNQPKPIAEIDLRIEPLKDIYLAMGSIFEDESGADFVLTINPLILFVWIGSAIMVLGTALAMLPRKRSNSSLPENDTEAIIDISLCRASKEDFA